MSNYPSMAGLISKLNLTIFFENVPITKEKSAKLQKKMADFQSNSFKLELLLGKMLLKPKYILFSNCGSDIEKKLTR